MKYALPIQANPEPEALNDAAMVGKAVVMMTLSIAARNTAIHIEIMIRAFWSLERGADAGVSEWFVVAFLRSVFSIGFASMSISGVEAPLSIFSSISEAIAEFVAVSVFSSSRRVEFLSSVAMMNWMVFEHAKPIN